MTHDKLNEHGRIPAHTECPFKAKCGDIGCHHKGKEHTVPFSCGMARGWEIVERRDNERTDI